MAETFELPDTARYIMPLDFADEKSKLVRAFNDYAPRFGVMLNGVKSERNLPFDPNPRIIAREEFEFLKRGLIQRTDALNAFLNDVYGDCKILKDGVVPADFVLSSQGFLPRCIGIKPRCGVYAHIAGIDLVKSKGGEWFVLEDNLRVPSGVSYPLAARRALKDIGKSGADIVDSSDYGDMLKQVFDYVSCGGIDCVLTPGRNNCAYFEHGYLAEITGSALACGNDLFADSDALYFKGADGVQRVGALYTRVDGVYADPLAFRSTSTVGTPNLFSAYAAGNVAVLNAFGCGAADDKGVYCFVPQLIKYYLGQDAILRQPQTFLPTRGGEMRYIEDNFDRLVIKDVSESGGFGVRFGATLNEAEKAELKAEIAAFPRRFIAQEIVDIEELPSDCGAVKADLRAFVVTSDKTRVWESGLTRFAAKDSLMVNSSQGGGFKDTWVSFQ